MISSCTFHALFNAYMHHLELSSAGHLLFPLVLSTIHSQVTSRDQIAARAWLCYLLSSDPFSLFASSISLLPSSHPLKRWSVLLVPSPGFVPCVLCTTSQALHDWFQGGSAPPTALVLISPFGVCRILPRPMPLSFGSFCVLRVTFAPDDLFHPQKKNNFTTVFL